MIHIECIYIYIYRCRPHNIHNDISPGQFYGGHGSFWWQGFTADLWTEASVDWDLWMVRPFVLVFPSVEAMLKPLQNRGKDLGTCAWSQCKGKPALYRQNLLIFVSQPPNRRLHSLLLLAGCLAGCMGNPQWTMCRDVQSDAKKIWEKANAWSLVPMCHTCHSSKDVRLGNVSRNPH